MYEADKKDYWMSVSDQNGVELWSGLWHDYINGVTLEQRQKEFMKIAAHIERYGLPALLDLAYSIGWSDGRWATENRESIADDKATE